MTNKLLKTLHKTAKGLHKAGVMDKQTMRKFDALCLPSIKTYSAQEIKAIRLRCRAGLKLNTYKY